MVEGEIVFALVYDVSMDHLFTAHRGEGAFLNEKRIAVNTDLSSPAILYDSSPVGNHTMDDNIRILKNLNSLGRVKAFGSMALHYAYAACGKVQAAVSTPQDSFPEFAGSLLVQEAGGVSTDFQGNPLTIETRHVIAACSTEFHQQIMEKLAES